MAKVGRDLYERLFRGYTRKQWALDPTELHASVCARIPVRTTTTIATSPIDSSRCRPTGYTALFAADARSPQHRGARGHRVRRRADAVRALATWCGPGPIDAFFDYRLGKLPYRSLRFEYETRATPGGRLAQPVAQVNYPNERIPYTRVTEFRHLTGQARRGQHAGLRVPGRRGRARTTRSPGPQNRELYHRYELLAKSRSEVLFVGRLARYQYLNMDQVVAGALTALDGWDALNPWRSALPEAA